MVDEVVKNTTEIEQQEMISPDVFLEQKDLTNLQTDVETNNLKEVIDKKIDTYDIIKGSKMYKKFEEIGKTDIEIREFAESIHRVVRKYLDQELEGFPDTIKNSMSVGIQFAMMETLVKQGAAGSTQFFEAFSNVKSKSATKSFEGLYKAFGKTGSVNEFFVLANKVQNLTRYLADKKNIIIAAKNIPELENPYLFKTKLLGNPAWSNQTQIDKMDVATLLTLNSKDVVDVHQGEEELRKIVDSEDISKVITKETIGSIQKSLKSADKLLDSRTKFKDKASDLVDKIAGFLDIEIPFLGNLGDLTGMKFPTDVLGNKKDGGVLNFVLGVLGFRGGVKGLHREYIREKLDKLHIDNAFITAAYIAYQKDIDATITNDSDSGTWKTCALSAPDTKTEAEIKAKIPADYAGLKKSILKNLGTTKLDPVMIEKFAPNAVTTKGKNKVVDASKITEGTIDAYLKDIIPKLIQDDFITSKNVDKDSFALAVMGGLVGGKYFIEGIDIGLISKNNFKTESADSGAVPDIGNLGVIDGKIDFSKGNFTPEQTKNINLLIDEMNKNNIADVNTQIGILSVISKESSFIPKTEISYGDTPNQDIRKMFGLRLLRFSESELTILKKDDEKFFDAVYGKEATATLGRNTGNTKTGDGYTYRGRGFNQITFKNTYKKYGDIIKEDLVGNPDKLNDPVIAFRVALAFFKEGNQGKDISTLKFTTKEEAAKAFARINAGNINRPGAYENKAVVASANFEVKENENTA